MIGKFLKNPRYRKAINLGIFSFAFTTDIFAVTLPSRLPSFSKSGEALDPGLEKWLNNNVPPVMVSDMTDSQVLTWIQDKDPITQLVILLEFSDKFAAANKNIQSSVDPKATQDKMDFKTKLKESIVKIPTVIQDELAKPSATRNPMLSQLYLDWKRLDLEAASKSNLEEAVFAEEPKQTCASKDRAIKNLTKSRIANLSPEELLAEIKLVEFYKSPTHKRKYLESLISLIGEHQRESVLTPLAGYARELPLLARRFSWLQESEDVGENSSSRFSPSLRFARRKKCLDAERAFDRLLSKSLPAASITEAIDVGSEIERCYKSVSRNSAMEFWERISNKMTTSYGKSGALWSKIRIGYIKWVANDLVEATKIYEQILTDAQPVAEFRSVVAKANYILGKIAEDKGDLDQAGVFYSLYIAQFYDQEDFEFALNSFVVNLAAQKKWTEILPALDKYLVQQSMVHIDRRPIGLMAFSLFWIGRVHLQLGHVELAREMWRRLAAEYYSTFYGAMGHYLLEQSSGKNYAIEPSRVGGFEFNNYERSLNEDNKRATKRSLAFLSAGLPHLARCEVEEVVPTTAADFDAQLVKTLLLYASGGWLDAIKIFDSIPRSIRNGLPVGFERVLFPRKYAEIVKDKATKLSVDPDFVFALMRQESVFSKDAMSPVGAMGLMQLMPSTARLELDKLSSHYISSNERSDILHALNQADGLKNPDVNVTLGVHHLWRLMRLYKSPVFALTAYNASPAATQKWQRTIASDDWLTFIERIPYKETRAYVKLILRNYFYYKRWYNVPDGKSQVHIDSVVDDLVSLAKKPG